MIRHILSQNCLTCKCQSLKVDPSAIRYLRQADYKYLQRLSITPLTLVRRLFGDERAEANR